MTPGRTNPPFRDSFKVALPPAPTLTRPIVRVVLPPDWKVPELEALVTRTSVKTTEPAVGMPAPSPGMVLTKAVMIKLAALYTWVLLENSSELETVLPGIPVPPTGAVR